MENLDLLRVFIIVIAALGLLLLLRGAIIWFIGITKIQSNQNEIIRLLKKIAGENEDKTE